MASLSLLRMRASYVIIPGWGLPRLQSQWLGLLLQSKGYVHHFEYALQDQVGDGKKIQEEKELFL